MTYTIYKTNGSLFATIQNGQINTSSSMTLIGKNYAGYGQFLDDNFLHLLENGANSTPPTAPLTGQVYFNTTTGLLNVYNGSGWKSISGSQASSTAPTNNATGDLWFNTTLQQLNVWTGSEWVIVGPAYTSAQGVTGAIPATILDSTSTQRTIVELYSGGTRVGIISQSPAFTPQIAIPGFTTISPGITLSTGVTNNAFRGNIAATSLTTTVLTTGLSSTAGTITGNWSLSASSRLSATYADLAERFEADTYYDAGTVVELGGENEVTAVRDELSNEVFGVVSDTAAYLMNAAAGTDETHPPIAMTGRVPVKVKGIVNKGDRLVSAGAGMARAAKPGEATSFNVIGRALASKLDSGVGTVEAIVTIK